MTVSDPSPFTLAQIEGKWVFQRPPTPAGGDFATTAPVKISFKIENIGVVFILVVRVPKSAFLFTFFPSLFFLLMSFFFLLFFFSFSLSFFLSFLSFLLYIYEMYYFFPYPPDPSCLFIYFISLLLSPFLKLIFCLCHIWGFFCLLIQNLVTYRVLNAFISCILCQLNYQSHSSKCP